MLLAFIIGKSNRMEEIFMRTVTETYNVYTYPELSEEAKEKVNQWYLDDPCRNETFSEIYTEDLKHLFSGSDLKMQYSLGYCQGDGLNIYGELDLMDVFKAIRDKLYCGETFKDFWDYMTEHEQKTIEAYMEVCGRTVVLPYNDGYYNYCVSDKTDFAEGWIYDLEYQQYKNIQVDTIRKMKKLVADMFVMLAKQYEEYGYKYFYEADEEEVTETCEANGWEFLEDGTFYAA